MADPLTKEPLEIERKFLIRFPDIQVLERLCSQKAMISQTYLLAEPGLTRRIRRSEIVRESGSETIYWYTEKEKITDITRIERERQITQAQYHALMKEADPGARTIHKTRYNLPCEDLCFEVDIFPEWTDRAYCEVELERETREVEIPECLEVIKEVTDDSRYTNASLARNGFISEAI